MKQTQHLSFSEATYADKKKQARRCRFLAEMEQVVQRGRRLAVIAPLDGNRLRHVKVVPAGRRLR